MARPRFKVNEKVYVIDTDGGRRSAEVFHAKIIDRKPIYKGYCYCFDDLGWIGAEHIVKTKEEAMNAVYSRFMLDLTCLKKHYDDQSKKLED